MAKGHGGSRRRKFARERKAYQPYETGPQNDPRMRRDNWQRDWRLQDRANDEDRQQS